MCLNQQGEQRPSEVVGDRYNDDEELSELMQVTAKDLS
jgi:hypothetical protein